MQPIIKNKVRILRPAEFDAIRNVLKPNQKHQLDALLLTGMRYVEAQRLQENKLWFDSPFINLPLGASLKQKIRFPDRTIRLSNMGKILLAEFFTSKPLPSRQSWDENLKRWAIEAGIGAEGMCSKTTRKTWESWLVFYYPQYQTHIMLSQGHTDAVSFKHYLNMPFTEEDKKAMQQWLDGWI